LSASKIEEKAAAFRNIEKQSVNLAKQNRLLKAQISNIKYETQQLRAEVNFLKINGQEQKRSRSIASVRPMLDVSNDLVKQDTYRWSARKQAQIAMSEFQSGNYEKSAQFFTYHMKANPNSQHITDSFLYQLGVSSYKSGTHFDWAVSSLDELINRFPESKYFRKAKLWKALSLKKQNKNQEFFAAVEEFRLKYRNTAEWNLLKDHYYEIRTK